MKKILSTLLAFGLTAGIAATAQAAHEEVAKSPATGYDRAKDTPTAPGVSLFSVKGTYSLVGASQSDGQGYDGVNYNGVNMVESNGITPTQTYINNISNSGTVLNQVIQANGVGQARLGGGAYNPPTSAARTAFQNSFDPVLAVPVFPILTPAAQAKANRDAYVAGVFGNSRSNLGNDDFYFHSFVTDWTLNIGDKIAVKSQLRFADRDVWGAAAPDGGPNLPDIDNSENGGRSMDVRQIYMEYTSPIGLWRMGRVPVAAWYGNFINSGSQGNRIMWWPGFVPKPWTVLLFTQKVTEADATPMVNSVGQSDGDTDAYYAGVEHKADFGTTAMAWWHVRNATDNTANYRINSFAGVTPDASLDPLSQNDIWIYGNYKIANFTIETEGSWDFGDNSARADADSDGDGLIDTFYETDRSALAFMLDVSGKFGPLSAGILYFYCSGDDNPFDSDNEAFMQNARMGNDGVGDDFNPYLILTGDYTGLLNQDKSAGGRNPYTSYAMDRAGVQSIGIHASYAVTPKLGIAGAIGAAWADKTQLAGQDDAYGIEYDLSASYKLLDNLTYGAHFGFLDAGDYFQLGFSNMDVNDITFMAHSITMNF